MFPGRYLTESSNHLMNILILSYRAFIRAILTSYQEHFRLVMSPLDGCSRPWRNAQRLIVTVSQDVPYLVSTE